jgi:hypothetical protein
MGATPLKSRCFSVRVPDRVFGGMSAAGPRQGKGQRGWRDPVPGVKRRVAGGGFSPSARRRPAKRGRVGRQYIHLFSITNHTGISPLPFT